MSRRTPKCPPPPPPKPRNPDLAVAIDIRAENTASEALDHAKATLRALEDVLPLAQKVVAELKRREQP